MAFARVQVELINDSVLTRDSAINTWHFQTPGSVAAAATDITDNLDAFYSAIQSLLSSTCTGTANLKFYDLEDATPRPPVATSSFIFSPGGTALPGEVACVLSFRATTVAGQVAARRRGRIFLGPLSQSSMSVSGGDVRISAGSRTTITAAAAALRDDTTLSGLIWSVFSPTTAGSPPWSSGALSGSFEAVVAGHVDDAYDTVRSRGLSALARTTF